MEDSAWTAIVTAHASGDGGGDAAQERMAGDTTHTKDPAARPRERAQASVTFSSLINIIVICLIHGPAVRAIVGPLTCSVVGRRRSADGRRERRPLGNAAAP